MPPTADTREKILDACLDAVDRHGMAKLQMGHIIERSGFSRRTVYQHFANRQAIVHAAYLREGQRLFDGARRIARKQASLADIFVASFLFIYRELPKNPLLRELILNHQLLRQNLNVSQSIFETLDHDELRALFRDYPGLQKDIPMLAEYWIQSILSMLILRGEKQSPNRIEAYVRRHFLPGLHLEDYGPDRFRPASGKKQAV